MEENKDFYYSISLKDDKVLGFNLTKKEMDKFYNENLEKQIFCVYGKLPFKVKEADVVITMKKIQNEFRNSNGLYSYIIASTENKLLALGFNESLEGMYATIKSVEELNPNVKYTIFETTGKHLEFK